MGSDWSTSSSTTRRGRPPETPLSLTRRRLLGAVGAAWVVGAVRTFVPPPPPDVLQLVHWANGHMMNTFLLPKFASEFNQLDFRISSGKRIVVQPVLVNSGDMLDSLS